MNKQNREIVKFNETEWIESFFDNSIKLDFLEIDRIKNFVFMWNLFESLAFEKVVVNLEKINLLVESLNNKEKIEKEFVQPYLDYFINRYVDGHNKCDINGLNFRDQKWDEIAKSLIIKTLTQDIEEPKEILKSVLYILYRFRNNLFHGGKEIIILTSQVNNFIYANNILKEILDFMKEKHMLHN